MIGVLWTWKQGRRLVINIGGGKNLGHKYWGGKNLGHKYWEGKNFGKIYFQTTFSKKILKKSFYSQKFLMTFFHRQLFLKNLHPSFKMYSLFFLFFFLCLCFCFLSCFLSKNKKNKKFSSDYWGQKNGFFPHLNYWGACARAAPPESMPMHNILCRKLICEP